MAWPQWQGSGAFSIHFQVFGGGFDLFDDDRSIGFDNPIDAAGNDQDQIRRFDFHGNRHLRAIPFRPLPLDFLMGTNPLEASPGQGKSHIQVTGTEHDVNQRSDGDLMSFLHACATPSDRFSLPLTKTGTTVNIEILLVKPANRHGCVQWPDKQAMGSKREEKWNQGFWEIRTSTCPR